MTNLFTRVLAAGAVLAALTWTGPQAARAQVSYRGGYDPSSGLRWDREFQYDPATNPFGFREPESSRPYYFGRIVYPGTYSYGAAPASYYYGYYGAPSYAFMPQADYSYGALSRPQDNSARIRLIVPADAKVWFGTSPTQQTGAVRYFDSPELTPGKDYVYDVKATWTENGKEVTQTRKVDVRANAGTTVDFTRQ
jgi:uncharacterized protein (TIGR03000 family)